MIYKQSGFQNSVIHVRSDKPNSAADVFNFFIENGLIDIKNCQLSLQEFIQIGAVYYDQKRVTDANFVGEEKVWRWHLHPKRYNKPNNLSSKILLNNQDIVIINKPDACPSLPTVDNSKENLLVWIADELGQRLWPVHRLDFETSGVFILAKSIESARTWQKYFQSKQIVKRYQALTVGKAPYGFFRHWMQNSKKIPKEISSEPSLSSKDCELHVLDSKLVSTRQNIYQTTVQLLTGRTHQIRSQLSYLGYPLWKDQIYSDVSKCSSWMQSDFRLHADSIQCLDDGSNVENVTAPLPSHFYEGVIFDEENK